MSNGEDERQKQVRVSSGRKVPELGDAILKCWGRGRCQGHGLVLCTVFEVALRISRWKYLVGTSYGQQSLL